MKIKIFTTADYANVDPGTGKLNILGAFNRIAASQFPTKHPRMVLALRLGANSPLEDAQPHDVKVVLTDEDGLELFQINTTVQLPVDTTGTRQDANWTIEFNALEFPHPGVYEFSVMEDGEQIGETTIDLIQISSPPIS